MACVPVPLVFALIILAFNFEIDQSEVELFRCLRSDLIHGVVLHSCIRPAQGMLVHCRLSGGPCLTLSAWPQGFGH